MWFVEVGFHLNVFSGGFLKLVFSEECIEFGWFVEIGFPLNVL